MTIFFKLILLFSTLLGTGCQGVQKPADPPVLLQSDSTYSFENIHKQEFLTGAEQMKAYLPFIQGKKIALLVNQTSLVGEVHLADTLQSLGIDILKIFAPEHGFRGTADAGELVVDGKDVQTGIPLVSLYGNNKKPDRKMLESLDYVIFDIQDVGARFYTYISTMSYVMEACAENDIEFLVLDRPNPNGHYVDGPVLEKEYSSFVGLHPVPVVHGMTVGEYAQMVNGEAWLKNGIQCKLKVISCAGYDHQTVYDLPVKPSPNLPNSIAVALYPSLCLFEGTEVSIGRGTDKQFQVIGFPGCPIGDFQFTPNPMPGAKYPKHEGILCNGFDLSRSDLVALRKQKKLDFSYLLKMYNAYPDKDNFFNKNLFFDKLAGTDRIRKMIIDGKSVEEIERSWRDDVEKFKLIRAKYLIYGE